ncbi:MAG: TraB/GumN family protein [Bacteroidetes bacterium]|nr:TraB/GumN family protein [Bacteroidota bacterium]
MKKIILYRSAFLVAIVVSVSAFAQKKVKSPDEAHTLLWRIEGNGLKKPSYLYGTMHSKQKAVFDFGPEVLKALDACDVVAGELKMDMGTLTSARDMLFLPDGKTLRDYLTAGEYDSVGTVVQAVFKQELSVYERFMPFYLATLMQGRHLMEGEMPYFLDQYLQEYATSKGKTSVGLETVAEQGKAFNAAGPEEQVKQLMDFVRKYDPAKPQQEDWKKMMDHYVKMDLKALGAMLEVSAQEKEAGGLDARQLEALVTRRNQVMAHRIDSLARLQPTFVAVGAAHLPGKTGIIERLRAQGFQVTPVAFQFDGKGYVDLAKAKAAAWQDFTSAEGGYSTRFPAKPITMDREQDGRKLAIVMHADMTGTSYIVNHMALDAETRTRLESADGKAEMERLMTQRLAQNGMKGEVLAQSTFEANGISGRQLRIKVSGLLEQIMDIRMFAQGDKLYTLMVMQPTASHQKAAADTFFEAFRLN